MTAASRTITEQGTATVSSTSASPGSLPNVTITSTGNCTATGYLMVTKLYPPQSDIIGSFTLTYTRTGDDTIVVYADRQLPAGKSIGFDWVLVGYTAAS